MNHGRSVMLDDHLSAFLEWLVERGRYGTADDAIAAGLRLLEAEETAIQTLRSALIEAEVSGPSAEFDLERFIAHKRSAASRAV